MRETVNAQRPIGKVADWLNDLWDDQDPWGSGMAAGFALCDLALTEGFSERIPDGLGYRTAMGGAETEDATYQYAVDGWLSGYFNADDVIEYLTQLDTFLDACKAAGLDY